MTSPSPRKADDIVLHDVVPAALRETPFCRALCVLHNRNLYNLRQYFGATMFRSETHARRFAVLRSVQSTSSVPVALSGGVVPCTEHCRSAESPREKSSDQLTGRPTKWSVRSLPIFQEHFGLKTLRLRSRRFVAAVFAPLSAISAANENGLATRSPSSSPKSSGATPCATSRSFPNGSHRPF
jgi:hypothetical protein